jgi:hypothetical protein
MLPSGKNTSQVRDTPRRLTMTKYHISTATGRVNICRATVKDCPVSSADAHFSSKEAAYEGRERMLNQEHGVFKSSLNKRAAARLTPLQAAVGKALPDVDIATANKLLDLYKGARFENSFVTRAKRLLNPSAPQDAVAQAKDAYQKVQHLQQVSSYSPQTSWTYEPGEAPFKRVLDEEGNSRGSIELRDGDYILGARNSSNRRLVQFPKTAFESEHEAVEYFKDWSYGNSSVITSD